MTDWTESGLLGTTETTEDAHLVEIVVPRSLDALRGALAPLESAKTVACDVETTGVRPYAERLLSVGVGARYDDGGAYVVIVPYELVRDPLPEVLDLTWDVVFRKSRRTVFQNGKFDTQFLARWFGEPVSQDAFLGDTLLLAYLLDERPRKDRIGSLGLKEQSGYRYDQPDYHWDWEKFYAAMEHDGVHPLRTRHDASSCRWPHPDPEWQTDWDGLYRYQSLDVYFTLRWWEDLVSEAQAESPRIMECLDAVVMPASKALAACEHAGAPLDFDWVHRFSAWLSRRIERRSRALTEVAGRIGGAGVNVGSPAQVADLMYDAWEMKPDMRRRKRTTSGLVTEDRSTDREHLEAASLKYMQSGTDVQRRGARWLRTLLRWRMDVKMMSTYSETLVARADSDHRVRASFLIHGTSTGRISSSGPNLQNIPAVSIVGDSYVERRSGKPTKWPARRAFAPRPGYLWVEADYSQLELRVAAALSGDESFTRVFVERRDIHLEVASTMFSKPPELVTKPERFLAKAVDFGILYGRTARAIVNGAEMDFLERELHGARWDEPTAQAFINKFLRGFPQLRDWIRETGEQALIDHYVETPFGRRRRFPFTPRNKYERMAIMRQAVNTPVQSAASDLCLMAMSRIIPRLAEGATMLFPVHDSVCLEVREDLLEETTRVLREEMEVVFMGVPLEVDVESGPSWAEVH